MIVRNVEEGWARYSTEQLELLITRLPTERGVLLPSVLAGLEAEVARRRDGSHFAEPQRADPA